MAALERLLARADADRAYLQPWICDTAKRLESIGGWADLNFQMPQEKEVATQVIEIELEEIGTTAAVIDNVLDPSWCQDVIDKHLQVGFPSC